MTAALQLRIALKGDLRRYAANREDKIKRGAMRAATRFRALAKLEFRRDTRAALGDRAANTWRDDVYPKGGKQSLHPAVVIFSKWPVPVRAHAEGATIVHREGLMLAIPTDSVPFRGRRPMTPVEVEAHFDQDLILVKGPRSTLAFIDKGLRGRLKRFRARGAKGAVPQANRRKLTLMFVLVRQVTLRPRIAPAEKIAERIGSVFRGYIAEEVSRELNT